MLALILSAVFSSAIIGAQDPQALRSPQVMARESLKVLFENADSPRQAWQELHLYQKRWCASFKETNFECEKTLSENEKAGLRLEDEDLMAATEWLSFQLIGIEKNSSEVKSGAQIFINLFTDKPWLSTLTPEDKAQMKNLHALLKSAGLKKSLQEKDLVKIQTALAALK